MSFFERVSAVITNALGTDTVGITNSALDVNIQDQTTQTVNLVLTQYIQDISIVTNTAIDDTVITISAAASPTVGNIVCLKEATSFYQGVILAVAPNGGNYDITIDTPLDYAFTTAGGCSERDSNMAKDGSVTPIEYSVSPSGLAAGTKWDITRLLAAITSGVSAMDDAKFGNISALTNGVYLRETNGRTKNLFNIKSNKEWKLEAFDVEYSSAAPAGSTGMSVRRTYAGQGKSGVVIRLEADSDDTISLWVQDDLTGLDTFFIRIQGHEVE